MTSNMNIRPAHTLLRLAVSLTFSAGFVSFAHANALRVVSGNNFACALLDAGDIKCWGSGRQGVLGNGKTTSIGDEKDEMGKNLSPVLLGSDFTPTDIQAGDEHVCALSTKGRVKCWGRNADGQLGLGNTKSRGGDQNDMGNSLPYVDLGEGFVVKQIALGGLHTCAVSQQGQLKCWGYSYYGQTGSEDTLTIGTDSESMAQLKPVDVGSGYIVEQVSAGFNSTCALLSKVDDGKHQQEIKCWGAANLGNGSDLVYGASQGTMGDNLPPVLLGVDKPIKKIVSGASHTCALFTDGTAKCWGKNEFGELGVGDTVARGDDMNTIGENLPFFRADTSAKITEMFAGPLARSTCVILEGNQLKCAGLNSFGQLGIGSVIPQGQSPDSIEQGMKVTDLGTLVTPLYASLSTFNMCAITSEGALKCFGNNIAGQLGQGHMEPLGGSVDTTGDSVKPIVVE